MNPFKSLKVGGVAIVGRTGSGKSSLFFGSQHVRDVIVCDTGSLGHKLHHQGEGECELIHYDQKNYSPVQQVIDRVKRYEEAERVWCLDSWSALEMAQVGWHKLVNRRDSMNKMDHKIVVGQMRDLGLLLATSHGFTLFNTGQGGMIVSDDGPPVHSPRGALVGYPSLSGAAPGTETILARWSSVWVIIPPFKKLAADGVTVEKEVPRGFLTAADDWRPDEAKHYTPTKDQYSVLTNLVVNERGETVHARVHPIPPLPACPIDGLLDAIAGKFPAEKRARKGKPTHQAEPSENGAAEKAPSGIDA